MYDRQLMCLFVCVTFLVFIGVFIEVVCEFLLRRKAATSEVKMVWAALWGVNLVCAVAMLAITLP